MGPMQERRFVSIADNLSTSVWMGTLEDALSKIKL